MRKGDKTMVTELIAVALGGTLAGMFLGAYLRSFNTNADSIDVVLYDIAARAKQTYGLKNLYVVSRVVGSTTMYAIAVRDFKKEYFIDTEGKIYLYAAIAGYLEAPAHMYNKLKAGESNIHLVNSKVN